ncbi:MAG: hypothetical protein WCA89_04005 [Terracidiphilus sp.]
MSKHRYFEELCALAALGDLPSSQSLEFESHLSECDECRRLSSDYLQTYQALVGVSDRGTDAVIESSRSRVKSAVWANIAQIDECLQQKGGIAAASFKPNPPLLRYRRFRVPLLVGAAAAAVFIFWVGIRYDHGLLHLHDAGIASTVVQPVSGAPASAPSLATGPSEQRLQAENTELTTALALERQQNYTLQQRLADEDRDLAQAIATQASLREEIEGQVALVKATQADLDAKRTALQQVQSVKSSDAATVASLEDQVQNLTQKLNTENASLDRERDLLSHGREIRDIIGARNLHIIDVYDTSTRGATEKPFARAFYTEGKSLIYYAYDLPQRRTDEGKFSYVAWGESNGKKASIRKIGILFRDDQTQRRWSLNFSDPRVLAEIDSVFITLERNDENLAQPKGKRMLTAYLETPANHP